MKNGRICPRSGNTGGAGGTALLNQMPSPVGTVPVQTASNRSDRALITAIPPISRPNASPDLNSFRRFGSIAASRARTSASKVGASSGWRYASTVADAPAIAPWISAALECLPPARSIAPYCASVR